MNIRLIKTDAKHPDFSPLVQQLDAYLAISDGDDHAFYDQYNHIDNIKYVIIAYAENKPGRCGAFKAYDKTSVEIKRMYTSPNYRGHGVASNILTSLETWAKDLGYTKAILETGLNQHAAIGLYPKLGYEVMPNFGPYAGIDTSICYDKLL